MKTTIRGTWNGLLPVRDVFVKRALNANEPLEITYKTKKWVIPVEQLRYPVMKKPVQDYIRGGMQTLMYYSPAKPQDATQENLDI